MTVFRNGATVILFSCFSLSSGCADSVSQIVWVVKHPKERGPDDLYSAISAVRAANQGERAAVMLVEVLNDESPAVRCGAVGALSSIGASPTLVIPELLRMRADVDKTVRLAAIQSLSEIHCDDDRIKSSLLAAVKDDDPQVRVAAIEGLGAIGHGSEVLSTLITALDDKLVRSNAALALRKIGPLAKDAVPSLLTLAQSKSADGYERLNAVQTILAVDNDATVVVPILIELLRDDYLTVRRDAAVALGIIGPPAREAIPALRDVANYTARRPITRMPKSSIRREGGMPTTTTMSEEEFYPQVRAAAVDALARIEVPHSTPVRVN